MSAPFIVFGAPEIGDEEIQEVVATMRSGWLGTGPKVAALEQEFAAYKGIRASQAAALNSCTAALHLSLIAARIGPGDEVITTPLTFCATVNAILHTGATPVLADVDPVTMNIDPGQIASRITARTKAILPVHFAGLPCAMDPILQLAQQHGLVVIEDCAHAAEALYNGRQAGTLGDFGCFSFYATKNITTGEGGMVIGRSDEQMARIRRLALHGMSRDAWQRFSSSGYRHYQVMECGFKYNMMDLQAAIGLHQLRRVEQNWLRRADIWQRYQQAFAALGVQLPADPPLHVRHAHHLYTIQVDEHQHGMTRDEFLSAMTAKGIGVGVHYLALPEHAYYQEQLDWRPEDVPFATSIGRQTVSLPLSANLHDDDVERIIETTISILSGL